MSSSRRGTSTAQPYQSSLEDQANVRAAFEAAINANLVRSISETVKERGAIRQESRDAERRPHPILVRLSDVQAEPVQWLWRGRIARGKLSLIVGDPGAGKSTLTLDIAARVSRGLEWPDGGSAPQGNVIILSTEDGLADTVVPRLEAVGADRSRITSLRRGWRAGIEQTISLTDLDILKDAIETEHPVLIIIDPLSAYMGETDTHREAAVRRVLEPVAALAERYGVAILALLHLNKSQAQQILYRASGSIAYVAAARFVLAVVAESDEDSSPRVYGWIKGNIGRRPPDLAYELIEVAPDVARVRWSTARPTKSIKSILQSVSSSEDERSERIEATEYLREVLGGDRLSAQEVIRGAREVGISERTLNRAKADLRVESNKMEGRWYWRLAAAESI